MLSPNMTGVRPIKKRIQRSLRGEGAAAGMDRLFHNYLEIFVINILSPIHQAPLPVNRKFARVSRGEIVKSHHNRWLRKKPKFKARESRGVRRTGSTPQRQRDEAQRGNWAFYEAINRGW
jgi:hypothetical protein